MRSTELQRKPTWSCNSLSRVPMASLLSDRWRGRAMGVDREDAMGTFRLSLRERTGGHRAGFAGPALTPSYIGRPNASELRRPRRAARLSPPLRSFGV